jgi:galactitol-specific phosphotransferase system IIC component
LFDDVLIAQNKTADKIFENHMGYFATGYFIGLMVGLVITIPAPDSNVKQTIILQPRIKKFKTPLNKLQWRIANLFPINNKIHFKSLDT